MEYNLSDNFAPSSYPFKTGKNWAGNLYTVIPGGADKTPKVLWKHLVWPERRLPSSDERVSFTSKGQEGASPLLLLDSPVSNYHLCVVDIDDISALKDVLSWLVSLGLTSTLEVKSGRKGGGLHLYFLREVEHALEYKSGGAQGFGTFKKADGKEAFKVDFKAYNSYAVCPGAIHKSGAVYTARWGSEEVAGLIPEVMAKLPVLPLAAWKDKRNKDPDGVVAQSSGSQFVAKGPEWEQVLADGRERQPCPWCHRGGDRILQYNSKAGTAHCYHGNCGFTRKMVRALPDIGTIVDVALRDIDKDIEKETWEVQPVDEDAMVDAALADVPNKKGAPQKVKAKDWAGFLFEQAITPVHISHEDIPVLDDDSPMAGKETKLGLATKILESRYGAEAGRHIACGRAPIISTGFGKAKGGALTERRGSCRSFGCPDCGPHLVEALRAATLGEAIEFTFGPLLEEDSARAGLYLSIYKPARARLASSQPRYWTARLRRPVAGHKNLGDQFRRLVLSTEGKFSWLGIQVSPTEVEYIFFFDIAGGGTPKEGSDLFWLFDSESPEPMPFDQAIQDAFEAIDFPAWEHSISVGASKRIVLLLGPSKLTEEIQGTFDWLTGRARKGGESTKNLPDPNRFSVATYTPSAVREVVADALQEKVVMSDKPSKGHTLGGLRSAELSTSPGPLLREAVKAGALESCSGHRKTKKVYVPNLDISILD